MELFIIVYPNSEGKYRWQLRNIQKKVMADSGEVYKTKKAAKEAISQLKKGFSSAQIQEL